MKKSILLLSIAFLTIYSCRQAPKDSFTIQGDIQGLEAPYIYLSWRSGDSTHTDSAEVKEGRFVFNGKVANPVMARVYGKSLNGYIWFYLENAAIQITGRADSIHQTKKITGSASQDEYQKYTALVQDLTDQQRDLYKQYREAVKNSDTAKMAVLKKKGEQLDEQKNEKIKAFIRANPQSFVSLRQLQGLTYSSSYEQLNKLFTALDTSVQNSMPGKKFSERLVIMEKTSIGKPALDFTQNNVAGNPVSLSDFKGKYVLVDFWASWCGPCRAENPNVVKAYNQYKDKGFTVLGVSLDEDAKKWKAAIKEDKLAWTQVSDLKGWKNEVAQIYGVHAIPANWLIDPNGMIIGHNLRGAALEKKLAEVLK